MFFGCSFSVPVKREIITRAGRLSELSGENSRPLSCAHLKHQAGRPVSWYFERPELGRYVTDIEHFAHHFIFKDLPRIIGLSKKQNNKTILGLYFNIKQYNEENNIQYNVFDKKFENAKLSWIELYDCNPKVLGFSTKMKNEIVQNLINVSEQYDLSKIEQEIEQVFPIPYLELDF